MKKVFIKDDITDVSFCDVSDDSYFNTSLLLLKYQVNILFSISYIRSPASNSIKGVQFQNMKIKLFVLFALLTFWYTVATITNVTSSTVPMSLTLTN
jgi:hypothetical protein